MNYRLIATSFIDGSLYDIAEFENFQSVKKYAQAITRWDIHVYVVNLTEGFAPYVMSTLVRTGSGR